MNTGIARPGLRLNPAGQIYNLEMENLTFVITGRSQRMGEF